MPFSEVLKILAEIVGTDYFYTDKPTISAYLRIPWFKGVFPRYPLGVILPAHDGQISDILKTCTEYDLGIRVRGFGSRTSPQTYRAQKDWILLSMSRLDRILDLDVKNRMLVAQAGISVSALQARLSAEGLELPIPGSVGSIGGLLSANSGGAAKLCEWVKNLKVCFADGTFIKSPPPVSWEGDSFLMPDIFYGSCGKFGIISGIGLICRKATNISAVLVLMDTLEDAARLTETLYEILPSGSRVGFLDKLAAQRAGIETQSAVYVEWEPELCRHDVDCVLENKGALIRLGRDEAGSMVQKLAYLPAAFGTLRQPFYCQVLHCEPMRLTSLVEAVAQTGARHSMEISISGFTNSGKMNAVFIKDDEEKAKKVVRELLTLNLVLSGELASEKELEFTPEQWLAAHPVYGHLEKGITQVFDPKGIFS